MYRQLSNADMNKKDYSRIESSDKFVLNEICFCRAGVFGIGFLLVLLTLVMVFYPRKEVGEVDIDQDEEVNILYNFRGSVLPQVPSKYELFTCFFATQTENY